MYIVRLGHFQSSAAYSSVAVYQLCASKGRAVVVVGSSRPQWKASVRDIVNWCLEMIDVWLIFIVTERGASCCSC